MRCLLYNSRGENWDLPSAALRCGERLPRFCGQINPSLLIRCVIMQQLWASANLDLPPHNFQASKPSRSAAAPAQFNIAAAKLMRALTAATATTPCTSVHVYMTLCNRFREQISCATAISGTKRWRSRCETTNFIRSSAKAIWLRQFVKCLSIPTI